MDHLFKINKKGTILFHPDAMNLCPELQPLNEKERLFLVLYCDYNSPFAQLPEADRLHKSLQQAFGEQNKNILTKQLIKTAIEKYNSLQYDPMRETMNTYRLKLDMISADLKDASSSRAISDLLSSQERLRKAMRELQEEIFEQREIQYTLKGGGTLSFIEQLMRNMEEYNRVTRKK